MTRPSLPSWEALRKAWGKVAIVIVVVTIAVAVIAFGWAVNNSYVTRQLATTAVNLSQQNLESQTNHHAATVKTQAQLAAALTAANTALSAVKESAAVIEYEGGVIAYQNGEIIAAQQTGHALLTEIQAIQQEVGSDEHTLGAALTGGQAQINAYLNYLSCLGTNPTNQAACGVAPPLPSTMGSAS